MFSLHHLLVDKDLRGTVREILHLQHLAYVASGGGQGEIARLIQQGEVDVEATVQARRQMTDGTLEAAMRALLRRSRHSMPELYRLTRRADGGRLVAEALNRCGRWKSQCPFCAASGDLMGLLSRRVKVTKRGNSHHGHYGEVLEARRAEPGEATGVWFTVALDGGDEACFANDKLQAVGSSDSYDHGREKGRPARPQ